MLLQYFTLAFQLLRSQTGILWKFPDVPSADGSSSPAAQLELFDDVADLLKPVHIPLLLALIVGNHLEKGHSQSGIPQQ